MRTLSYFAVTIAVFLVLAISGNVLATNQTATIEVKGMYCPSCAKALIAQVGKLPGVQKVDVSYEKGTLTVSYDDGKVKVDDIKAAIQKAGFTPGSVSVNKSKSRNDKGKGGDGCCRIF